MAPYWLRTKEHSKSPFAPKYDADDWLLLSNEFVVGRILLIREGPQRDKWSWSMTGIISPKMQGQGVVDTLEQAQAGLTQAWREWQAWAGCRDAD